MGTKFEHDATTFTIVQSSRKFRIGFLVFALLGVAGVGIGALVSQLGNETKLTCDRAAGKCELERNMGEVDVPLAQIAGASYERADKAGTGAEQARTWIALRTTGKLGILELCGRTGDPKAAAAAEADAAALAKFLADPAQPKFAMQCASSEGAPQIGVLALAFPLGLLVLAFLFSPYSVTIRARFDAAANTVEIDGRRWFARRWSVRRPLSDVTRVVVRSRTGAYGSRYLRLWLELVDGSTCVVWAPMIPRKIEERRAELEAFLANRGSRR